MLKTKPLIVALLSLFSAMTYADSSLDYGASIVDQAAPLGEIDNFGGASLSGALLTTDGLQSVVSEHTSATVNAWANPETGMFKSIAKVNVNGTEPTNIALAYASFRIADTLRFSGPGSTANVNFTMYYDTIFSGLEIAPFPIYDEFPHVAQALSYRNLSLSYDVANPNYDPLATCQDAGTESEYCPTEMLQTLHLEPYQNKELFSEVGLGRPIGGYPGGVYTNGNESNGHYTGQVDFSVTVPTNVDISFNYMVTQSVSCWKLISCSVMNDASHSEYLGLQLEDGASFVSASGYQYQGLAAVPEPETYAMLLAGLALTSLVSRRRCKS